MAGSAGTSKSLLSYFASSSNRSSISEFKLAAIQLAVGADKLLNVQRAVTKIGEAVSNGANVVVLPVSSIWSVF